MPPGSHDHHRRTSIAWTLPRDQQLPSESRRSTSSLNSQTDMTAPNSSAISIPWSAPSGTAGNTPTSSIVNHPIKSLSSSGGSIRLGSPPPPPSFVKRVSFDTFDNKDATDFSLTLKSKHKDYTYSRRSRTFLCGTDQNDYSEFALEWLLDELVDDGDEIVCLRVVDKDSKISSDSAMQEKLYRQEAEALLDKIIEKNEDEKAISIILEFAVGKVHETIQRMIHIYEPVILIVGTRGRSLGGLQGLLPGSVSKYCLQHSPVPVIVVRPSSKRDKKKAKRKADPNRRVYKEILQSSGSLPGLLGTNATTTPVTGMSAQTSPVEQCFPEPEKLFAKPDAGAAAASVEATEGRSPSDGGEGTGGTVGLGLTAAATADTETPSPSTVAAAVEALAKAKSLEETSTQSSDGLSPADIRTAEPAAPDPAPPPPQSQEQQDAEQKSNSSLSADGAAGA